MFSHCEEVPTNHSESSAVFLILLLPIDLALYRRVYCGGQIDTYGLSGHIYRAYAGLSSVLWQYHFAFQ